MRTHRRSLEASRSQVFISSWVLYAGYYICRKDISPSTGSGISSLALSLIAFGAAYTLSQFAGGILADRFSARRTALIGAGISILCTGLLAFHPRPAVKLSLLLGNGLGQGFGWPALLHLIGKWFDRGERDRVLAWWSISYILGGVLATSFTAWLIFQTRSVAATSFQPAYLVSSAVLLAATLFFYIQTAHLTHTIPGASVDPPRSQPEAAVWREIFANRGIQAISAAYFFLKMTRYTLLFWLPLYLTSSLGYAQHAAEHLASYFELLGFLGPLIAAWMLQHWLGERRMILAAGMLFVLAFVCLLHPVLAGSGELGTVFSIALMGALIYGADVLLSAMAVFDTMPASLHGRAAGFVNGIGSIGQTSSPFLVTVIVLRWGWTSLFDLFVFFALVAGGICAFGARFQTDQTRSFNRSVEESVRFPRKLRA